MDPKTKKLAIGGAAIAVVVIIIIVIVVVKKKKDKDKSKFSSDVYNWPSAGQFGAMADTYPYGNYSGDVAHPYYVS